jgi:2-pyrone-4,6-dicarboxylate lactonase
MHAVGVRGVRFAFLPHIASETTPPEVIQSIARKVEPLGWHVDLYFLPPAFDVMEPLIASLPTPVLIDHMGRPDVSIPVEQNEYFQKLLALGARRNDIFWKVTSPDRYTRSARPEDWGVALPFGHELIKHFPRHAARRSAHQNAQRRRHRQSLDLSGGAQGSGHSAPHSGGESAQAVSF